MTTVQRAVLVTGAAGGIGRATAQRLSRSGWAVLAVDRDTARLDWAERAGIASIAADIATEDGNRVMVQAALAEFGRLDAAVLNAGVTGGGAIDAMPIEDFRHVLDVNLVGTVMGIRAVLPALRQTMGRDGDGAIAVTASTMGLGGDAENWAYCAAKHGLVGLVRSLARELGGEGIRINALCPGPTRATGMTAPIEAQGSAHFDALARAVPLRRWADPDEMAASLEFLVSPASSYVNGHALVADGGAMVGTGLVPPKAPSEGNP
ncbi:MAG TPA: SDR family oxidoreductase [Novosphingobium sp.]|nr:SDR family oxidoreductase [Novosphingobium sp.]